jgi:hypothetical protein
MADDIDHRGVEDSEKLAWLLYFTVRRPSSLFCQESNMWCECASLKMSALVRLPRFFMSSVGLLLACRGAKCGREFTQSFFHVLGPSVVGLPLLL